MESKKIILCSASPGETRAVAEILRKVNTFEVLVCENGIDIAAELVKKLSASLLVVNLSDLESNSYVGVMGVTINSPETAVLVYGTTMEYTAFLSKYMGYPLNQLEKPAVQDKVIKTVCRAMGIDGEQTGRSGADEMFGVSYVPRILVVDDDPMSLKLIKRILDDSCELRFTANGANALTIIKNEKPNIVLLDYMMPVMDGRQVLAEMRSDKSLSETRVIFTTGVQDREHIRAVMQLRPEGYLIKPIKKDILVQAIKTVLSGKTMWDK